MEDAMATEKAQGWDATPRWTQIFGSADNQIAFTLKLASVKASGWALGKSMQECEAEARRRLAEGE